MHVCTRIYEETCSILFVFIIAAAEGANLCVYHYDDLKKEKKPAPEIGCYVEFADSGDRCVIYCTFEHTYNMTRVWPFVEYICEIHV